MIEPTSLLKEAKGIQGIPTAKSAKLKKGTFEVLNPGKFSDKYNISTHLGEGAFGSVNKCTLKEDSKVVRAVKQVWK